MIRDVYWDYQWKFHQYSPDVKHSSQRTGCLRRSCCCYETAHLDRPEWPRWRLPCGATSLFSSDKGWTAQPPFTLLLHRLLPPPLSPPQLVPDMGNLAANEGLSIFVIVSLVFHSSKLRIFFKIFARTFVFYVGSPQKKIVSRETFCWLAENVRKTQRSIVSFLLAFPFCQRQRQKYAVGV